MSNRWSVTKESRKYKCYACLCLMGLHSRCLNNNCIAYVGALSPDRDVIHTYAGRVARSCPVPSH